MANQVKDIYIYIAETNKYVYAESVTIKPLSPRESIAFTAYFNRYEQGIGVIYNGKRVIPSNFIHPASLPVYDIEKELI